MEPKFVSAATPDGIPPFNFPSEVVRVYQIVDGAKAFDIEFMLETRLSQLDAMLSVIYGAGGEAFRENNDTIQDNYLWACSVMATECKELFKQVSVRRASHE